MHKKLSMAMAAGAVVILAGCSGETPLDAAEVTARFGECLDRNEVVYEGLELELDADGKIETLAVKILSEREAGYEPAVRLACTEEVEALAADR